MPANRRRSAITAPYDRWVLLGSRLERRRRTLGHTWRTTFERDSGVNKRLQADIEKAAKERVNTFMPGTLELVASGYRVTHASVLALLRDETDDLDPLPDIPAVPAVLVAPPGWSPPTDDRAREGAVRPYVVPIWERLLRLAARGVTDPSGAQLGLSPEDAKVWDGTAGRGMEQSDRAWVVADLQRRGDGRGPGASTGAAGA